MNRFTLESDLQMKLRIRRIGLFFQVLSALCAVVAIAIITFPQIVAANDGEAELLKQERVVECQHDVFTEQVVLPEDCMSPGVTNVVCDICYDVVTRISMPEGHCYGDYRMFRVPTADANGIEVSKCLHCGERHYREYVCEHIETHDVVIKNATCSKTGLSNRVCDLCTTVVETVELPVVSCTYGDWQYTKYALPDVNGVRCKSCVYCGKGYSEEYVFEMPSANSIYIPGTGICHSFAITGFTQADVDRHNIIYSLDGYGDPAAGRENPCILGHSTRTLGALYKTTMGQTIYISVNGVLEKYKVVVSEYALMVDEINIVGQSTGTNYRAQFGCKAIHLLTCYGGNSAGRWIVIATKIS